MKEPNHLIIRCLTYVDEQTDIYLIRMGQKHFTFRDRQCAINRSVNVNELNIYHSVVVGYI